MSIELIQGDCLEKMKDISDKSVDAIICDLPYGTTACAWDSIIDLELLWEQYKRVIKPYKPIVLFGSQPFTTRLISSNYDWFKYCWIWKKNRATGHVHAKNRPMKLHEDICIFSEGNTLHINQSDKRMPYYPQGLTTLPEGTKRRTQNDSGDNAVMSKRNSHKKSLWTHTGYPTSIITFDIEMNEKRFHETQKPLELIKYLIKTYTNETDLVLDNTMGSGTTGVACLETNRRFIGIEKDAKYFEIAKKRIEDKQKEIESKPKGLF